MSVEDDSQKVVYTNRSAHLVKQVRELFLEEYDKSKDEYYDEDVEKVRRDDWFVKRFLIARGRNVKNSTKMLVAAMKWRKTEKVREFTPNMFPAEFYQIGALFRYREDKEGNAVVYFRIKYLFRIPEVSEALKQFGAYLMFKLDEEVDGRGFTGVVDFAGTGLKNCELGLLRYCITVLTSYLPAGVNHILVCDLPKILRALWFTTRAWIPENRRKLVQFVDKETIQQFIDSENLPKFLGGTCKEPYKGNEVVPENCITCYDLAMRLGVSEERTKEIIDFYEPYLLEKD